MLLTKPIKSISSNGFLWRIQIHSKPMDYGLMNFNFQEYIIHTTPLIVGEFTTVCNNKVITKMGDTGGICYEGSLTTDTLDWNAADSECSTTNRRLARVLNEEMSDEIERVTQDTDEYWIVLSIVSSNSEFMWYDGTSVSSVDSRWSSGHPKDGLNCVSVRGNSTEWYSSDCSETKRYICEKVMYIFTFLTNSIITTKYI